MKKIHKSWDLLTPRESEKPEYFGFDDYYKRISNDDRFRHIPKLVLEQWIYPHHNNGNTIANYAWINYETTEFIVEEWDYELLQTVNIIDDYVEYVNLRKSCSDFNQFCCIPEDVEYWRNNGTWKTPPIILNISSFTCTLPGWSDLKPPYQLVEGHSRIGYLHSAKMISEQKKGFIAANHLIFLMRCIYDTKES